MQQWQPADERAKHSKKGVYSGGGAFVPRCTLDGPPCEMGSRPITQSVRGGEAEEYDGGKKAEERKMDKLLDVMVFLFPEC